MLVNFHLDHCSSLKWASLTNTNGSSNKADKFMPGSAKTTSCRFPSPEKLELVDGEAALDITETANKSREKTTNNRIILHGVRD